MNNLYRELAPISESAWGQIEEEATRTVKRHLAARRVVDVQGPDGFNLPGVGTGHLQQLQPHLEGVETRLREVKPMLELRVPFSLDRRMIDDVERGALDSDWQAVKDAARQIAFAEDRAIFDGFVGGQIGGLRTGSSNPRRTLPPDALAYPRAITEAVSQLRLVGVNGPYSVVLSADAYTLVSEASDSGYPILDHIQRVISGEIIWAPAIAGAFVVLTRGGDFALHLGEDISIGYLSHTESAVRLYLEETLTFLLLTQEACVAFDPAGS